MIRKSFLFYLILIISFFLAGCGYKSSNYYAKKIIKGKVFVQLYVNLRDPENTVLLKDAMNEILVHNLGTQLVYDKSKADIIIYLKLDSVSMKQLQYDTQGFTKLYEASVNVNVKYESKKHSNSFNLSGFHNFSIDSGTTITDTKRFEAIKSATSKALENLISKLAIEFFRK